MQSGERYGMPSDMQPFTTALLGGSGARGSPHLFGHPQSIANSGSDMSGLHTQLREHGLHLHGPSLHLHSEQYSAHLEHNIQQQQQHQQQQQLRAPAAPQQQQFLHPALGADLHHVTFFKNQNSMSAHQQQLRPSHSPPETTAPAAHLFMAGVKSSSSTPDQFKLSHLQKNAHDERDRSASVNRWQADETAALVKICSDMDSSFRDAASKGPLWEEVSRKLQDMGYERSPQKCEEKFENIHKYYKRAKDGKSYRFLNERSNNDDDPNNSYNNRDNNNDNSGQSAGGEGAEIHGGGLITMQRQELEFSSDFSSEGGHAGNVQEAGGHAGHAGNVHDSEYNDDDDDEHEEIIDKKKRKVSSWSPSKSFFERLTRQIMEKQEGLHRNFLETIDKKDRERVMREEAYRRQETARLNREQEIRAQEVAITAARDSALIAFLEKATGHSLSLPKVAFPPLSTPVPSANAALMQPSEDQLDEVENGSDLNTKRWPKVEVHALIRLRSGMEPRFKEAGPKAHLWQEISASMACLGFIRSPKRCKEKWENINKYFKKTKDSSKKRPENAKTCPYFHQLDALYQRGILTSSSTTGGKLHGKADSLLEFNTEENEGGFNMQNDDNNAENMQVGAADTESNDEESAELAIKLRHAEQLSKAKEINNDQVSTLEASQSSIFPSDPYNGININQNQGSATGTVVLFQQQMDKFLHDGRHHESITPMGTKKSMQVELFVKDILDLQQQQHQKLVDEYDRMEQAHELRELERLQQIKAALPHTNTHDNATLMALVHKLAGDSSDLTMSTP